MKPHISQMRKLTPNLLAAQALAAAGLTCDYDKKQVERVLKALVRAKASPTAILTLDYFYALPSVGDLQCGDYPTVWPSNRKLTEITGRSESQVQRALTELVDLGVIAFHDSPNCKRRASQQTGEQFGISLIPGCELLHEHEQEVATLKAEKAAHARTVRAVKNKKRNLTGRLTIALQSASEMRVECRAGRLRKMLNQVEGINQNKSMTHEMRLEALEIIEQAYETLMDLSEEQDREQCLGTAKMRGKDRKNAGHQYNSNLAPIKNCANTSCSFTGEKLEIDSSEEIDIELVEEALEEVSEMNLTRFSDWKSLLNVGRDLKRCLQLSHGAYEQSLAQNGACLTVLAMAVVCEFVLRKQRGIENPAGYCVALCHNPDLEAILHSSLVQLAHSKTEVFASG